MFGLVELGLNGVARPAGAGAFGAAALDHEAFDDAVKRAVIVVADFRQAQNVGDMAWSDIPTCKKEGLDVEYLMLRGVWATLSPRPTDWRSLGTAPEDRAGILLTLRRRVIAGGRYLSPRAAFLVNSLLLGEQAEPPGVDADAINTTFRNSGTIHILVVSGTQVMFLLAPILWICRRSLWLRR